MEKVAHPISLKTSGSSRVDQNQKSKIKNQKFFRWLLLLSIILPAAFLRLYRIGDYMTFLGDEGRDVLVVYNILHGNLTLLGPTASVGGFFLGPIYYYFMAPFLWLFNYNPVGPAVMVALFGVATVWLIYKVGSEFFGSGAAIIAAILYSISPLAIAYSRSSWNPNLMPFFSLLALYILYKGVRKNKIKLFVLCGVLLGIAMQLHYLATFLGVIIGICVFLFRCHAELGSASIKIRNPKSEIRNNVQNSNFQMSKTIFRFWSFGFVSNFVFRILKYYFYILLGFLIGWSPFLLFEVRHGFPNLQSIINFIFQSQDTGITNRFFDTIHNVFFRLFGRLVTNFLPPEQVALGAHPNMAVWYYATLVLGIASVLIFLFKLYKSFKQRTTEINKYILILIWLFLGIGLFGFYKKSIYDYYFGFLFPLPFMLVGLMIEGLYTNSREYVRYIVGAFFKSDLNRGQHKFTRIQFLGRALAVGIFASLVWINLRGVPFRFPPNRQLEQVEEIAKFVVDKTDGKPFNFALITGGNSDHAYRYFFTLWEREPIPIENPQKDPKRKTVTEQLLVICETNPCAPLGHSLWEIAGFGRAEIIGEWNISVVKVYKLKHL